MQTADSSARISKAPREPLLHQLDQNSSKSRKLTPVLFIFAIIIGGIFSGYLLSRLAVKTGSTQVVKSEGAANVLKVVGSDDTKTFPDTTEGILEAGGINGEGTHKLKRTGGESQTVYLTSSVLDLDQFVGQKVRVWGQTFAAQRAGWLMDVGKLEVLN